MLAYSSFPLIWSSTNMIFLAPKWTNFKLHQNDHPPKWSKLRIRGKLESFLMITNVLLRLFCRFVLCENNFYEGKMKNYTKNSLFLLRNHRLCILYILTYKNRYRVRFVKAFRMRSTPFFEFERLLLSATSNPTKMITHQYDLFWAIFLKLTKMIFHFSGKLL